MDGRRNKCSVGDMVRGQDSEATIGNDQECDGVQNHFKQDARAWPRSRPEAMSRED